MAPSTSLRIITGARLLVTLLPLAAVIAAGASVEAASVSVSWNAPTTNVDGTPLTDLAGYRIYLGTASPTCPSASFLTVSSPTTKPASGQNVSTRVTALSAGTTYFARVTAVDIYGNESACSSSASGVAQPDFNVTPSATSFGSVTVNSTVDRTFTVQNTGKVSMSGAASVGVPFRIVSGNSFSLAPGATQTVTVRFRPTTVGTFAANVKFDASGDTISRGVSGSATASTGGTATSPPPSTGGLTVAITQPTGGTVSGTNWAVVWVSGAMGTSNVYTLSVGGRRVGTVTTASTGPVSIPWNTASVANGRQVLTASVRDAGGHTGRTSRTVTVSNGTTTATPPPRRGPLRVFITQPTGGAIVAGTAWVVMWVEGSSGSSNLFTLRVDGARVSSATTSARGPVTLRWITTSVVNGSHRVTATVRDAAGNTGSTTINVAVRN